MPLQTCNAQFNDIYEGRQDVYLVKLQRHDLTTNTDIDYDFSAASKVEWHCKSYEKDEVIIFDNISMPSSMNTTLDDGELLTLFGTVLGKGIYHIWLVTYDSETPNGRVAYEDKHLIINELATDESINFSGSSLSFLMAVGDDQQTDLTGYTMNLEVEDVLGNTIDSLSTPTQIVVGNVVNETNVTFNFNTPTWSIAYGNLTITLPDSNTKTQRFFFRRT